jgi:hypothetical protein
MQSAHSNLTPHQPAPTGGSIDETLDAFRKTRDARKAYLRARAAESLALDAVRLAHAPKIEEARIAFQVALGELRSLSVQTDGEAA